MIVRLAIAVLAMAGAVTASAQTLYAASVRTLGSGGGEGVAGSLYTVNLGSGSAIFVAPIRLGEATPIGITGLAVHPETGVFYGITSPQAAQSQQFLVTLDPQTGRATPVGNLKLAGSDIAFNRAGILFTWLPTTSQVGIVNIANGDVTPIGRAGPAGPPAGIAIDLEGRAYIAPKGAGGSIDTVDIGSGTVKPGPALTGAPFATAINSMTFTPSGLLLAVNSNGGAPAETRLVTINVATGAVSNIGTLPNDTDALAFAALSPRGTGQEMSGQSIALIVLAAIALVLGAIGFAVGRRPRR